MSIRLNVVLCQSSGGSPQRRDLESEVVARLIGAAGIDLSLIGPLESLAESSTDRLVLERLSGDLALLSWDPPAVAASRLAASKIPGRRAPHPLDSLAVAADRSGAVPPGCEESQRRIYHHWLGEQSAAALHTAIERLLASRRVVTFPLTAIAKPPSSAPASRNPPSRPVAAPALPEATAGRDSAGPVSAGPVSAASAIPTEREPTGHPPLARRSPSKAAPSETCTAPDPWDALVDELNDSDI